MRYNLRCRDLQGRTSVIRSCVWAALLIAAPVVAATADMEKMQQQAAARHAVNRLSNETGCIEFGKSLRAKKTADDPRHQALLEYAHQSGVRAVDYRHIEARTLRIGMTWCAVYASIGRAAHGNRTVTAHGQRDQLVYRERYRYVYLEDGTLTSWQE